MPSLIVLIDGRNVLRSRWPNIPERRLVELCTAWARAAGHRAVLVFDGTAPAGESDEHCDVVGSGAESADTWLERRAAELETGEQPYWLVTSDRALRAVAGRHAQRTIGGGAFVRELTG